jgi:hypothetical protein
VRPGFIIDRGWEVGPEVCNVQDEGWFGDWAIGYDPKRMQQLDWWYKNADIYRQRLYALASTRPSFCIAWETPCHTPPASVDALEYHFTSIGAFISNVEVHGKLDRMTPAEKAAITRWVKWNWTNREFLQYTQILTAPTWTSWQANNPAPAHVDAIAHLRNEYQGKFGFICMWNPGPKVNELNVDFPAPDYFIHLPAEGVSAYSLKHHRPVEVKVKAGHLILNDYPVQPQSWDILEIKEKGTN